MHDRHDSIVQLRESDFLDPYYVNLEALEKEDLLARTELLRIM